MGPSFYSNLRDLSEGGGSNWNPICIGGGSDWGMVKLEGSDLDFDL